MLKSELEAAISVCSSQRELADYFGHKSTGCVRVYAKKYGLTLPIIRRPGWSDDELREAVSVCQTMSAVMRLLGLNDKHAAHRQTIRKYVKQLELDTSHWKGQGWSGKSFGKSARSLDEILVKNSSYSTSALRKRLLKEGIKSRQCDRCLRTEWEGELIPLELEHVNGVNNDHRIENLKLLCCNCHALTPTWRGRKGALLRP